MREKGEHITMRSGKYSKSKQPVNIYSNNTITINNLSSLPNSNPPNESPPSLLTTFLEYNIYQPSMNIQIGKMQ